MHKPPILDSAALADALADLPGWSRCPDRAAITRVYRFQDFTEAFAFMTRCALAAERLDHHPDWSNSWNQVTVMLSTHASGGVTHKDVALAQAMDQAAS